MAIRHDSVRNLAWALSQIDDVLDAYCPSDCDSDLCDDDRHLYPPDGLIGEVEAARTHLHSALAIGTAHVVNSEQKGAS